MGLPVFLVKASMFPSLGGWWSKSTPILQKTEAQNSQNIAFLEPAPNLDLGLARGGGDINMSDTALSPEVSPSGQTIADIESEDHQGRASLYVVRQGDTLPQIAKMFGVTANTILWANDLKRGASLRGGQTLVILPVSGVQHTVKKGETIESIAKKYKGDVAEIQTFNDINSTHALSVGDTIIVPDGVEVPAVGSTKSSPKSARARMIAKYPSYEGYYTNPLPTGHKTQGIHGYNGVDIGAPTGDPIYAAAEGTVIVSHFRPLSDPWFGGYGNYVIIEHPNNTQTLYGHMSAVYVAEGAQVSKGQSIGEVGSTGKSTGPHLHFEVRGAKNFMN